MDATRTSEARDGVGSNRLPRLVAGIAFVSAIAVGLFFVYERTPASHRATRAQVAHGDVTAEVLAAYQRAWDVQRDALRALDTSKLPDAYDGQALAALQNEVDRLRSAGQVVDLLVDLHPTVSIIGAATAVIDDVYTNRSAMVDPATGVAVHGGGAETLHDRSRLVRGDAGWKVVSIDRQ